ncbi:hypothetical protein PPL_00953 [Heterostelium album PN500]|uniref:Uncharacterized protein n=1 Tax=Heterostelium pallidum (strain ATCC 26659 / Pp 5 / PN500) TaxID=670386 RepID=D3AXP6_HETP5|nr:hypothetical protein PPL_00953 [Heterostelium album PN500]EFA85723.1 hypothetical protein PPL_00953 [Heterostelium album PN500]|eukprot:XP_020437829.1 hypothetical protein PPL_00953 [Heterostelium album PN500]
MKFNLSIIFLCFVIITFYINSSSAQGISFQGSSAGGKPGNVTKYRSDPSWKYIMTTRAKARYDWTWCRLHVRDELTNYTGYADFHPRVDEFTTLRVPLAGYGILFNPHATIWIEFFANISVTNDVYRYENQTFPCPTTPASNTTNTSIPTPPAGACNASQPTFTVPVAIYSNFTTFSNMSLPPKRVYYEKPNGNGNPIQYMVNTFTVVATVDLGTLIEVQWDGDRDTSICKQCPFCLQNQCAVQRSTMLCDGDTYDVNEVDTNQKGCTLKIFLAWKGTDSQKKPCISIAKAPSNFSKYSFYSISQMGLGLVNDFLQRVIGNTNNPNTA